MLREATRTPSPLKRGPTSARDDGDLILQFSVRNRDEKVSLSTFATACAALDASKHTLPTFQNHLPSSTFRRWSQGLNLEPVLCWVFKMVAPSCAFRPDPRKGLSDFAFMLTSTFASLLSAGILLDILCLYPKHPLHSWHCRFEVSWFSTGDLLFHPMDLQVDGVFCTSQNPSPPSLPRLKWMELWRQSQETFKPQNQPCQQFYWNIKDSMQISFKNFLIWIKGYLEKGFPPPFFFWKLLSWQGLKSFSPHEGSGHELRANIKRRLMPWLITEAPSLLFIKGISLARPPVHGDEALRHVTRCQ